MLGDTRDNKILGMFWFKDKAYAILLYVFRDYEGFCETRREIHPIDCGWDEVKNLPSADELKQFLVNNIKSPSFRRLMRNLRDWNDFAPKDDKRLIREYGLKC